MTDETRHNGIPEDDTAGVLRDLGIREHTPEDCEVSEALYIVARDERPSVKAVIAEGRDVWLFEDAKVLRYRIDAGDRRRILAGYDGPVRLHAPEASS